MNNFLLRKRLTCYNGKYLWSKWIIQHLVLCFYLLFVLVLIMGLILIIDVSRRNPLKLEHNKNKRIQNSSSVDEFLYQQVRILCWIMTSSQNYIKRAQFIRPTWGKRCNKLLIIGANNQSFQYNVNKTLNDGRDQLWYKTKFAFNYIYDNHISEADWFLKVDDDTYVIMENLRYFLYAHDPTVPIYFGSKFRPIVKQGYMSGGAGYVLSKEALRRFAENFKSNSTLCKYKSGSNEDVRIGQCLESLNVIAADTYDDLGFARFFPLSLLTYLVKGELRLSWYLVYRYTQTEKECCSEYTISFHYMTPELIYFLEMMLYRVHVHGIVNRFPTLPEKLQPDYYQNLTGNKNLILGTKKPKKKIKYKITNVRKLLNTTQTLTFSVNRTETNVTPQKNTTQTKIVSSTNVTVIN